MRKPLIQAALLLALIPCFLLALGQAPPPPPGVTTDTGAANPPPAADAPGSPGSVSRWPMRIASAAGDITLFQPQLEDFQGDKLKARAALSVAVTGQDPVFGAVWLESRVATDRVARTVHILEVNVTQVRFPTADAARDQALTAAIKQTLTAQSVTLSLDQLLAMLETVKKEQTAAAAIDTAPPKIVFRDHPAVLVTFDGQPKLVQVDNSKLMRVINTPFFIALDPAGKAYFLKGAGLWFTAADPMGPYQALTKAPDAVAALADSIGYQDPQQPVAQAQAASLEIVTATEPTELIWTDGAPEMGIIAGTNLLYVTNTDADMFLTIDGQDFYVLISGRWYTAPNRNGPWTYVPPDKLPDDFHKIPVNSEKGDVLAHVAGTQAAKDAVADTYVPQTAAVDRNNYDQPPVDYDGDPQFTPIAGTAMSYAVNCPTPVVLFNQGYYCCYNAVWYRCGSARGRWEICTAVPGEIYTIPPSCPIYGATFCYVYGFTPDVCYVGYLPGYVGCYAFDGVVVYGTGFHYRPWIGHEYYPRPCTFGFAARYNSYAGHWGFNFSLATGGAGRAWIGAGAHGRDANQGWFGFGGFRPALAHNDVRVGLFQSQYDSKVRPDRAEPAARRTDQYFRNVYDRRQDVHAEPGMHAPAPRVNDHAPAPPRDNVRNNVFVDQTGNVYRKTIDGWETRDKGQWKPAPSAPAGSNSPSRVETGHGNEHAPATPAEPGHGVEHPTPAEPGHVAEHPAPARAEEPIKDLNEEYRARVNGDARLGNYERQSPPPEPAPSPAPRGGGENNNGGNNGGNNNGGGNPGPAPHGGGRR